jgi:hypothetical protein
MKRVQEKKRKEIGVDYSARREAREESASSEMQAGERKRGVCVSNCEMSAKCQGRGDECAARNGAQSRGWLERKYEFASSAGRNEQEGGCKCARKVYGGEGKEMNITARNGVQSIKRESKEKKVLLRVQVCTECEQERVQGGECKKKSGTGGVQYIY